MAGSPQRALILATDAYSRSRGLTQPARSRAPTQPRWPGVLADPDIGGFAVESVVNHRAHRDHPGRGSLLRRTRNPDDLLLLHFACHGVKDDSGELYFAATDTRSTCSRRAPCPRRSQQDDRPLASRQDLLLLDCCYSGAFARGITATGSDAVDIGDRLGGRGRAVITASSALSVRLLGRHADRRGDVEATDPVRVHQRSGQRAALRRADRDLGGDLARRALR